MKKFKFRFESLLRYRKLEERKYQKKIFPITQELSRVHNDLRVIGENLESYNLNKEKLLENNQFNISFRTIKEFQNNIADKSKRDKNRLEKEILPLKEGFKKLISKRKVLEKIKEKHYGEYLIDKKRKDQKEVQEFINILQASK